MPRGDYPGLLSRYVGKQRGTLPATDPFALPAPPVDLSSMPTPPQAATVINVGSSGYTVSGTLRDVTFNVTSSVANAIIVPAGATLERAVVNTNGLVSNVAVWGQGGGTVRNVRVNATGNTGYGFKEIKTYGGVCYATRCSIGFYFDGTGVYQEPLSLLKAYDCNGFGFYVQGLYSSTFDGVMFADYSGGTASTAQGTGFEVWMHTQNCTFNYVVAKRSNGYGAGIARATEATQATSAVQINVLDIDGAGASADSDPGIVITGGTSGTTIGRARVRNHTVGITIGEYDFLSQVRSESNVSLGWIDIADCAYGALRAEYGSGLTVSGLKITNCSTVQASIMNGALTVGRASGGVSASSFQNVQIANLQQSGTTRVPIYAVSVAANSTGSISGSASSWQTAKVQNASAMTVSV